MAAPSRPATLLMAAVPGEGFDGDTVAAASLFAALARVTARSGDTRAAMAWADRALELAEPREDVPIVAEAVLAKASVLNQADRRFEAAMVLDGLIRFAEVHSLTAVALEARNLFAYVIWDDDPQLAYSTARTGMDHAARVGDRLWWVRLLIASSAIGFTMGDWDWVADACDEAQLGPLEAWDQVRIGRHRSRLGLYRGQDVDEAIRAATVLAADRTDPMAAVTANWIGGGTRPACMAASATPTSRRWPWSRSITAIGTDAYPLAARAALWAGDLRARPAGVGGADCQPRARTLAGGGPSGDARRYRGAGGAPGGRGERLSRLPSVAIGSWA